VLIYDKILLGRKNGQKQFALLLDPDKVDMSNLPKLLDNAEQAGVDFFFVGGSLLLKNVLEQVVCFIKKYSKIPVVLFPGSIQQIEERADALLFLSLLSGRNPDLLIGQHVKAAPILKNMDLEVMPTAYLLIDGGKSTTASYISNTTPIPFDKPEIAACTAMAGELLGMKLIYVDTGSGAEYPVPAKTIALLRKSVDFPIIVGGGIRDAETAFITAQAGADIVVVGTAVEKDETLLQELVAAVHNAAVQTELK